MPEGYVSPVPEGLDPAIAVVIPSALTGFVIQTAGGFEPGQTVLVQGVAGVAGRLAVQVARKLGAGRTVATGRREEALREVAALGVDATIDTAVSDDELVTAFREHARDGYDVVLDFLWGRLTVLPLRALTPDELGFAKPVRVVQVGASAGEALTIHAAALRTSGIELVVAAKGFTAESMSAAYEQIVAWTRDGDLTFNVERVPLSQIETAWTRTDLAGKRLVAVDGRAPPGGVGSEGIAPLRGDGHQHTQVALHRRRSPPAVHVTGSEVLGPAGNAHCSGVEAEPFVTIGLYICKRIQRLVSLPVVQQITMRKLSVRHP